MHFITTEYRISPKDSSSSSSRESAAEGLLELNDSGSMAADPHSRSAGIDWEDAKGCCPGGDEVWMSRSIRLIRLSEWVVWPVPVDGGEKKRWMFFSNGIVTVSIHL